MPVKSDHLISEFDRKNQHLTLFIFSADAHLSIAASHH